MNDHTRNHFPEIYEQQYHVKVLPTKTTSYEAYHQRWLKQHKSHYIETSVWEKSDAIDDDEILIEAAWGGDPDDDIQYFCIKREKYLSKRSEFGYVIEDDDLMMEKK